MNLYSPILDHAEFSTCSNIKLLYRILNYCTETKRRMEKKKKKENRKKEGEKKKDQNNVDEIRSPNQCGQLGYLVSRS